MTAVGRDTVLCRAGDACSGVVGDGVDACLALWPPAQRRMHLLNPTGSVVWDAIDRPISFRQLVDRLALQFEIRREVIAHDIEPLVAKLLAAGLLQVVLDSPATDATPIELSDPVIVLSEQHRPLVTHGPTVIGPLRALGVPLVVHVVDPQLHASLAQILSPLVSAQSCLEDPALVQLSIQPSQSGWTIVRDGAEVSWAATREQALRALLVEVNTAPLDRVEDAVVLHASGVSFGDGSNPPLVLFPGVSNSGKSTLAAQLCLRGHGYLTDEAVAIDTESVMARPFHKSVCIELSGQSVLGQLADLAPDPCLSKTWDIDPRRLANGNLSNGGRIDGIVFPTYAVGAMTSLERLAPVDALQQLIANAFDFARVGQAGFSALVQLANSTPSYTLLHGGSGAQLVVLEELFGARVQSVLAA